MARETSPRTRPRPKPRPWPRRRAHKQNLSVKDEGHAMACPFSVVGTWKSGPSRAAQERTRDAGLQAPVGAFRLLLLGCPEIQRRRIHAITQARGRWAVLEDVAQMGIAFGTADFGSHHAVLRVAVLDDPTLGCRLVETWPACA